MAISKTSAGRSRIMVKFSGCKKAWMLPSMAFHLVLGVSGSEFGAYYSLDNIIRYSRRIGNTKPGGSP